jgi:hypothetical protein
MLTRSSIHATCMDTAIAIMMIIPILYDDKGSYELKMGSNEIKELICEACFSMISLLHPDADHLDTVGGLNPGAVRAWGTNNPQTICQCSGRDCPSHSAALFIYMPVGALFEAEMEMHNDKPTAGNDVAVDLACETELKLYNNLPRLQIQKKGQTLWIGGSPFKLSFQHLQQLQDLI